MSAQVLGHNFFGYTSRCEVIDYISTLCLDIPFNFFEAGYLLYTLFGLEVLLKGTL